MGLYIFSYSQANSDEVSYVGNKGIHLGLLQRAGVTIPEGFILSSQSYHLFLIENSLLSPISNFLQTINYGYADSVLQVSGYIKKMILNSKIPNTVLSEINTGYDTNGFRSDTNELTVIPDLTYLSGISHTFPEYIRSRHIKLDKDLLKHAIIQTYAELFNPSVLTYAYNHRLNLVKIGMAIIIQTKLCAEKSGKIYTFDPVTNDKNKLIVKAIFGEPHSSIKNDTYVLSKNNLTVINREIVLQHFLIMQQYNKDIPIYLLPHSASKPKLTLFELVALAKLGNKLEQLLFFPQAVDWIIAKERIYIVKTEILEQNLRPSNPMFNQHKKTIDVHGKIKIIRNASDILSISKGDILILKTGKNLQKSQLKSASALIAPNYRNSALQIPIVIQPSSVINKLKDKQSIAFKNSKLSHHHYSPIR